MIGLHMPNATSSGSGGSRSGGFSTLAPSKSQLQQHHHNHNHHDNNIIRISAKTAPQIVSSVPKCRNSKTSHFYPMETIKGISAVGANNEQQMFATHHHHHEYLASHHHEHLNRALMSSTSGSTHLPLPKKKGVSRKSQPLPLLAANNQTDDDHHHQVVLIVNDDHKGAPIIGRRLPSKSMSSSALNSRPPSMEGPPEVATTTSAKPRRYHDDSHPVVGRRSRRFVQQNQQQRAGHIYQYERLSYRHQEYHVLDSHHITTESSSGSGNGSGKGRRPMSHHQEVNYDPYDGEQQPLSIVETQAATSQQVLAIASHHHQQHRNHLPAVSSSSGYKCPKLNKNHAIMLDSLANYNEHSPQIDGYAKLPVGEKVRGRKLAGPSGGSLHPVGRRLTSTRSSRGSSASPPSCPAGCPCGASQLPYPVRSEPEQLATSAASDESPSCRHCYVENSQQPSIYHHHPESPVPLDYLPSSARSASCQRQETRRSSCCPKNQKAGSPKKRLSRPPETPRDCCRQQMVMMPSEGNLLTSQAQAQSQRPTRSQISHHHYDYSTNYDQHEHINHEQASRPSGSHRSSSCHEPRQNQGHQQAPMLISGRNVLPVHPKPVIHAFTHAPELLQPPPLSTGSGRAGRNGPAMAARNGYVEMAQSPDLMDGAGGGGNGAVGQMYESLAAELKAKLGDPKMGPILLPPKDYDTMSRKQGKLTGIELRRSTNPQLVGPTKLINCYRMSNSNGQTTTMTPSSSSMIREEANPLDRRQKMVQDKAAELAQVYRNAGGSSRSSGRSQDAHDDGDGLASLHRSRSNSSSGLGSISMGAGSPNSSPSSKSSSSEDMRHASRYALLAPRNISHLDHTKTNGNYSTKIIIGTIGAVGSSGQHNSASQTGGQLDANEKQRNTLKEIIDGSPACRQANSFLSTSISSPDYCGASDSGHSDTADQMHKQQTVSQFSSNMPSDNHSKFEEDKTSETNNNNNERDNNCANNNNNNDSNQTTMNNPPKPKASSTHNPGVVSEGVLWNGRVEIPLKVNRDKNNGNTYLATKQIIY